MEGDAYLLNISRYIHRNSIEAGIARKVENSIGPAIVPTLARSAVNAR